ncbi:MAG: exosortase C-terminal domain/associated protein EpsI [Thermoguttaceae bacterium]
MINRVTLRVCVGIAAIGAVYGVARLVQISVAPPDAVLPPWTVHDLPMQLGPWHGETTTLNPKIAAATGASDIEDRLFRDDAGNVISLHTAMFSDPTQGMRHLPVNCYRSSGWKLRGQSDEKIRVADDLTLVVRLMTWEKESDTVLIACWYQLGQRVLQTRVDLGEARWTMRGLPKWPVMFKTMAQIPVSNAEESKTTMLRFIEQFAGWFDQPSHQKYFDQWPKS